MTIRGHIVSPCVAEYVLRYSELTLATGNTSMAIPELTFAYQPKRTKKRRKVGNRTEPYLICEVERDCV